MNLTPCCEPLKKLHLGCGDRLLPSFINIDIGPSADLQLDLRQGLPFADESCDCVYSEHFIEHIDRAAGLRLLRELRRVLVPGGTIRIATPDLKEMVNDYQERKVSEEWIRYGYIWTRRPGERLNLGMREWGHQWMYDEEELRELAAEAGLEVTARCGIGTSAHPALRELEHRSSSKLILELTKPDRRLAADAKPLVSIPIPAYRATYFEEALLSALHQTWDRIEVIVCDDCPDSGIEDIVKKHASDGRLRYVRNPQNLGGFKNLIRGFELAQGEFIKFLNDDDVLEADCIERLLDGFRRYPDITLSFSKRRLIDEQGGLLPDQNFSAQLAYQDCAMDGQSLAGAVSAIASNVIGEPSTALFRRAELAAIRPHFMTFAGYEGIRAVNDLATWFNLLSRGNAAYIAAPLSSFRRHPEQRQMAADIPELAATGWQQLVEGAFRWGLADSSTLSTVKTRATAEEAWQEDDSLPINRALTAFRSKKGKDEAGGDGKAKAEFIRTHERIFEAWQLLLEPEVLDPGPQPASMAENYKLWRHKHSLEEIHAEIHAERMVLKWPYRPRFLMIVPLARGQEERVARTIGSLERLFYDQWQIVFLADFDAPADVFHDSEMLGWLRLDSLDDELIVQALNALVQDIPCDWLTLLPAGTELSAHTLLALGDYAFLHPEWHAIYTDHDQVTLGGQHYAPKFKPDFNLDYLRSMDYIGAACWFRRESLLEVGGFTPYPGAWHYDLLWRLHDQIGAAGIGHIAEPLHHLPPLDYPLAQAARQVALENHLRRAGVPATVHPGNRPDTLRVEYRYEETPLVSIIIPNRDAVWYLKPCLESLFARTDYPNYEVVLVDNQTDDPDTLAYYRELKAQQGDRVRILRYDHPFNFSAQCNLGVEEARGEYLLLLNNDTEIVQESWLSKLVSFGLRPEVGAVGARLVFPEKATIQHAGVVIGMDKFASHVFLHQDMNEAGYMNRLQVEQNYSAVTAACMLVRKSAYQAVGGMDAEHAPVLFNDVDLCLKLREAGLLVVWTPTATLVHHESKSLATETQNILRRAAAYERDSHTADALHRRWLKWTSDDPAYNRHLSLNVHTAGSVDPVLVADWDRNFHDRKRVLAFPVAGGVGEYRFIAPLKALASKGILQSTLVQTRKYHDMRFPTLPEVNRLDPDIFMHQVAYSPEFLEWVEFYRKHRPEMRMVLMLDDLITHMPEDNPNYRFIPRDGRHKLRKLFRHADRVIVSTEPLREFVSELAEDVRMVPNTLRDDLWAHLRSRRRTGKKPRIGWAGAQQHKGDLAIIAEVVKETSEEVDWVFFGMCPENIRPYIAEYHEFEVGVEAYPAKLASLNLDIAVAPLELHPFNEAKSNLRLLEYGILGFPVICTDILPYRTDNPPVRRVANDHASWLAAIREHAADLDAAAREGDRLREWVQQRYMLGNRLEQWHEALTGQDWPAQR